MTGGHAKRIVLMIMAVLAVQLVTVLVYRQVERSRSEGDNASFPVEALRNRPSPDVILQRRDGSTLRLSELRGRVVLLHFWGTWCPPCRKELPELLALGRGLGPGFQVVAVSLDHDWEKVAAYFAGAIPPEVVRDPDRKSISEFEVSTLPDTYLIDAAGTVRLRFGGARSWDTRAAREILAAHATGD